MMMMMMMMMMVVVVAELKKRRIHRGYKNYIRISPQLSQKLLERVSPSLEKETPLWPVWDHGLHKDMLRICCDCVTASTIIYCFLRSLAVDYGRNKIFEHVKNRVIEKPRRRKGDGWSRNIMVISYLRIRDGYPTDNPALKPWRFRRPNRESQN